MIDHSEQEIDLHFVHELCIICDRSYRSLFRGLRSVRQGEVFEVRGKLDAISQRITSRTIECATC